MKKFAIADVADKTFSALADALNNLGLSRISFVCAKSEDGATEYGITVFKDGVSLGSFGPSGNSVLSQIKSVYFYGDEDGEFVLGTANNNATACNYIFAGMVNTGIERVFKVYTGSSSGILRDPFIGEVTAAVPSTYGIGQKSTNGTSSLYGFDSPLESNAFAIVNDTLNAVTKLSAWPFVRRGSVTVDGVYATDAYDDKVGSIGSNVVIGGKNFVRLTDSLLGILD